MTKYALTEPFCQREENYVGFPGGCGPHDTFVFWPRQAKG